MIAGPWACGILADQGAEVIKIEEPTRGDLMRHAGSRKKDISSAFHMANRGKRGVALDLRRAEGIAALRRLIETADVLLHNNRPGVMERLGLGYDDVRAVRGDIIYVSISAYGESGPLSRQGAYDPIMQCFTGMAWFQGKPAGEPALVRMIICDKVTALMAAQAIAAALYARRDGRGGQELHVSMLAASAAFNWVELCRDEALLDPDVELKPAPVESYRLYRFADGWASVTANGDEAFLKMLELFGVEGVDDPRLRTFASRLQHPDATERAMKAWEARIADVPIEQGIAMLRAIDIPCSAAMTLDELAAHPQAVAADIFMETDYPGVGRVREVRPPVRFSVTPARVAGPAPSLGEHSREVLNAVGVDAAALKAIGVTR
jgi:crotonobetainyl-CoA:carnitine CoA-transferase CaiB-like acyl-CoA transferase